MTTLLDTPPLKQGEELDQVEFHRRYLAMPEDFRAELVGGKVYIVSPVFQDHGKAHGLVMAWLGAYRLKTKGTHLLDNATTILGSRSEPQPDAALVIDPACGGRTSDSTRVMTGAPELVVEVSDSTESFDLGPKFRDYESAGVLEYVVVLVRSRKVKWFQRQGDCLLEVVPDDGLFRSSTFPGLWLNPDALLRMDEDGILAALDRGMSDPGHAEFVTLLRTRKEAR